MSALWPKYFGASLEPRFLRDSRDERIQNNLKLIDLPEVQHAKHSNGRYNSHRSDTLSLIVRKRTARLGRNPATGEAIKIKASKKIAFRAAKDLKEAI
jgi:hypothetical protein